MRNMIVFLRVANWLHDLVTFPALEYTFIKFDHQDNRRVIELKRKSDGGFMIGIESSAWVPKET